MPKNRNFSLMTGSSACGSGLEFVKQTQPNPRLAQRAGHYIMTNDDPDYSPDGQYIYFNSNRSGNMQIWRMHPDGTSPEQITSDDLNNWTPHLSPDGKSMVFLSYDKGETGHPANKDIALRIMSLSDRKVRVLVNLTGGSGTINVPSWSPDSRHLAFVSYQMLPSEDTGSSE